MNKFCLIVKRFFLIEHFGYCQARHGLNKKVALKVQSLVFTTYAMIIPQLFFKKKEKKEKGKTPLPS